VRAFVAAAAALLAGACATQRPPPPLAGVPPPAPIEQHLAAIHADAERSEHEHDAAARAALSQDASRQADACLTMDPTAAACLYGHAIALGLEARAHPAHAVEALKQMLAALGAAEAADPGYDEAGPARVRALVLTRAPGWPLGPGDPAAGVAAARRAVSLRPGYPPNVLALAEALAKSGDTDGARAAFQEARDQAQKLPASAERDEWLSEANRGLQR